MSGEKESTPEAKDGLTSDPDRDPAAALLLGAPLGEGGTLLLVEGGCGRLASHFAPRFREVINHNILFRNHLISQQWLATQGMSHVRCQLSDLPRADQANGLVSESCDEIIFRLGRGTALVNAVLMEAFKLLRPGGSLWVSGHNQEGIKSFAKRAEAHFGNMHLLRIKSSCRLLRFQKQRAAPVQAVEDPAYFQYLDLEIGLPKGDKITYRTKPGIFSYRATDIGTGLLAFHLPDCSGREIMDLGCGSGVLSLIAFKLGAKSVLALDANVVATLCATENFSREGLPGKALCTNLTEGVEAEFDLVLTNPPFHHGSETDYAFPGKILDAILPRLRPGGSAYVVANRFLDYASQAGTRFQKVEVLSREHGYCVYHLVK